MDFRGYKVQCLEPDISGWQAAMSVDEIHYKSWRIEVLHGQPGWKTLVYRPTSPLHGVVAPDGPDRHAVMEEASVLIEGNPAS